MSAWLELKITKIARPLSNIETLVQTITTAWHCTCTETHVHTHIHTQKRTISQCSWL